MSDKQELEALEKKVDALEGDVNRVVSSFDSLTDTLLIFSKSLGNRLSAIEYDVSSILDRLDMLEEPGDE